LVVVVEPGGKLAGVLTKTDLIHAFVVRGSLDGNIRAAEAMQTDVLVCHQADGLHETWAKMRDRNLKCLPVLDLAGVPLRVVYAPDAVELLFAETEGDEEILRDYVMGIGYQ